MRGVRWPPLHPGGEGVHNLVGGPAVGLVVQQQARADVCHLPGQLGRGQAHVERHQHSANAAGPVDELDGGHTVAQQ